MVFRLALSEEDDFLEDIDNFLEFSLADVQEPRGNGLSEKPDIFLGDLIVELSEGEIFVALENRLHILDVVTRKKEDGLVPERRDHNHLRQLLVSLTRCCEGGDWGRRGGAVDEFAVGLLLLLVLERALFGGNVGLDA